MQKRVGLQPLGASPLRNGDITRATTITNAKDEAKTGPLLETPAKFTKTNNLPRPLGSS